jgi:hypothetical protein
MSGSIDQAVPRRRIAKGRVGFVVAICSAACLVAAARADASTQAPTFSRTDYSFIGNEHVTGDFNGDGSLDLAGTGAQVANVRLNNGAGGFGAVVAYPVASWPQDLAAGDFDRDGRLDLMVTINDPAIGLSLLRGNGDGTFAPAVNFANTVHADSPVVVAVDLNNDAKLDVVVAHSIACYTAPCIVSQMLTVMLGNGDGTFQPARDTDVGRGMAAIDVGDFNRDGNKDLAIAGDSSRVYRLYGVGDGTFVQQPTLTLTADTFGVDGTDLDVADLNGDSMQDLVVAIALNGSRTAILIGNADGTFQPPLILTEPNLNVPQRQAVADFNGDGFLDLALSLGDGTQGLMEMRNGNGDGTFQTPVMFLVPAPKSSVAGYDIVAASLDGDSRPDIALGISGASPGLAVLLNSTGTAPPATPAAPTLVSPAQDASTPLPVTLDWTDVGAATSYRVQVDDSSSFSSPLVLEQTVTASQLTISTLAARQHWWRVRGVNSAGTLGAWSSVRRFTPQAAAPGVALSSVSVTPASVTGGAAAQGSITLTSAAPAGGFAVTLSSSNTAVATLPASVSVAQGATSASFAIATTVVATSTPVTITATAGAVTRTATLTVNPPSQAATLTVTATGRSGTRITSSPAGISVAVGSSGSASFATGTRITLTASNGRSAIWSGACSSGSSKTRSCTFTLQGNAAVTGNVQ